MRIKVISNILEFENLEEDWNRLFRSKDNYSTFQSFEFNYFSWKFLLNKSNNILSIVVLYDGTTIKSILPFYIDRRLKLRFINDIHADFCDYLTDIEIDFDLVVKELKSNFTIRHFYLINLRTNSCVLENKLPDYCKILTSSEYLTLPLEKTDSFPSNFTQFVYRQKRRLKRILKKYPTGILELISYPENDFPLKEIQELRKKMIDSSVRKQDFLDADFLNLIKVLYDSKKLKISVIKLDNQISALSFFFQRKDEYSFWIDMFDEKQMINLYHNTLFIKTITEQQTAVFNFGRGNYSYKIQNFSPKIEPLFSVNIFRSDFSLKIYQLKLFLITFVKSVFRKIK